MILLLHAVDRRDPRFHYVSEYALAHPVALGAGFAAAAAAGGAVAVILWRRRAELAPAASVLLLVFALGMILLALFPTDHAGRAATSTTGGRVHNAAADLASLSLLSALMLAWASASVRAMLAFAGAVVAAATLPRLVAPEWFGVHQRIHWGTLFVGLLLLVRAVGRPSPRAPAERAGAGATASRARLLSRFSRRGRPPA